MLSETGQKKDKHTVIPIIFEIQNNRGIYKISKERGQPRLPLIQGNRNENRNGKNWKKKEKLRNKMEKKDERENGQGQGHQVHQWYRLQDMSIHKTQYIKNMLEQQGSCFAQGRQVQLTAPYTMPPNPTGVIPKHKVRSYLCVQEGCPPKSKFTKKTRI